MYNKNLLWVLQYFSHVLAINSTIEAFKSVCECYCLSLVLSCHWKIYRVYNIKCKGLEIYCETYSQSQNDYFLHTILRYLISYSDYSSSVHIKFSLGMCNGTIEPMCEGLKESIKIICKSTIPNNTQAEATSTFCQTKVLFIAKPICTLSLNYILPFELSKA